MSNLAPPDHASLRQAVLDRFDGFSLHSRQIARHLLDEPNDFAFETLTRVAERCGVQSPSIVRFAQQFGFDDAVPMQRLLLRERRDRRAQATAARCRDAQPRR